MHGWLFSATSIEKILLNLLNWPHPQFIAIRPYELLFFSIWIDISNGFLTPTLEKKRIYRLSGHLLTNDNHHKLKMSTFQKQVWLWHLRGKEKNLYEHGSQTSNRIAKLIRQVHHVQGKSSNEIFFSKCMCIFWQIAICSVAFVVKRNQILQKSVILAPATLCLLEKHCTHRELLHH